ncbi:cl- channel voltage-gated family protein [Leptolyngbya sp. Heron Island J]|uniref:chloride channel protein n=1 Tax=Leptolyngbya sp. Heron Island J TaxID=1385935 RepID=UPI0003B9896B|nr:chloride channel protein [Leptolyngbya sp. Heron Island J]ESA36381.1 cl- channel voltage-gated family protein [Leptolyngbya sp. Heron Island J]
MTIASEEVSGIATERSVSSQQLTYFRTLLYAAIVGGAGGLVATIYYFVLEQLLEVVWGSGKEFILGWFPVWLPHWHYTWLVATLGGLGVGLCLHFLGLPGEMAIVIDRVHDAGRLEPKQTPGMIATSLISITAGGSLGPEAPLVQINGSLGSWIAEKLNLTLQNMRVMTFCGMGAALAAFFGDPIGGPMFALEIPHRRGLEYYEAIIPAMVAGICSFAIFRMGTGLEVGGIYNFGRFGTLPSLSWLNLVEGAALGVVGALAGVLFIGIFRLVKWMIQTIEHRHILLALMGGLGIGWIAVLYPATLFFSEQQIETQLLAQSASLGVMTLLGICLTKMIAICFTIHGGFRGGFIFPLFFTGASLGLAIAFGIPTIHPTIAVLCCMAAINVAITKTPISTTIILTVLSDTTILPVVAIASFTSFLLTSNIGLLKTQRARATESLSGLDVPAAEAAT